MTPSNHQDHISLSMITAGAAALAAVFFIMNLGNAEANSSGDWRNLLEAAIAMAATVSYATLALNASTSITNPNGLSGDDELQWKVTGTRRVMGIFWVMLVMVGFLVFTRLLAPAILEVTNPGGSTQEIPAQQSWKSPEGKSPTDSQPGTEDPGDPAPAPDETGLEEETEDTEQPLPGDTSTTGPDPPDQND